LDGDGGGDDHVGWAGVVDIATCYGLDGPESNPSEGDIFRTVLASPGAHPASYRIGTGSLSRG